MRSRLNVTEHLVRYFFGVQDGHFIPDEIGTELADLDAVRDEALNASVALLKGRGRAEFWTGEDWTMNVTDETGKEILVLRFSAEKPSTGG